YAGCRRGGVALSAAKRLARTCVLVAMTVLLGATGAEAANLVGWWNLADGMGTTATDSSPLPAGGSPNHGTLMNIDVTTGGNGNWNDDLTGATDGITMPHGLKFDGGIN